MVLVVNERTDRVKEENASQHEANKMLRVLNGTKLKYTVRLILPTGKTLEMQTDKLVDIKHPSGPVWSRDISTGAPVSPHSLTRKEAYDDVWIMEWIPGSIIQTEENPK